MFILTSLITFLFLCIAFISAQPQQNIFSPILSYSFNELDFILKFFTAFFLGFIIVIIFFFYSKKLRHHTFHRRYVFATLHAFESVILGFLLSFVLLFI